MKNTPYQNAQEHFGSPARGEREHAASLAPTNTMRSSAPPVTASAGNAAVAQKIEPVVLAEVYSYLDVVTLFEERREPILAMHLINDMRAVSFETGRIEVKPVAHINPDIPARINRRLAEWTGTRWNLVFNEAATGEPTIREVRAAAAKQARDYAIAHPKVQAVLETFPGATVVDFIPNKH